MYAADRIEAMIKGFAEGLAGLDDVIETIPPDQERDVGYEAARQALAPYAWSKAIGDRIDTSAACDLLSVTRQALSKRVKNGSLLGLPGKSTTYFPTWQFDVAQHQVRPMALKILQVFKDEGAYDAHMVAAWMRTPNEDLHQAEPAKLIENGEEGDLLITVATLTARSWAS